MVVTEWWNRWHEDQIQACKQQSFLECSLCLTLLSLGIKEGRIYWMFSIKVPQKRFMGGNRSKLFLETLGNSLLLLFLSRAKNSSRGSLKCSRRQSCHCYSQRKLVPMGWDGGQIRMLGRWQSSELSSHLTVMQDSLFPAHFPSQSGRTLSPTA